MKIILINVFLAVLILPLVYWLGYDQGAFHQRGLDAPSKAMMVAKMAELYEEYDNNVHMLMYTYLDTELSFYEEYLDTGIPVIAELTSHAYFIEQNGEYLSRISEFVHSTNDGENEYKQEVADRLKRLGY